MVSRDSCVTRGCPDIEYSRTIRSWLHRLHLASIAPTLTAMSPPKQILGVDAAWTPQGNTGVALIQVTSKGPVLKRIGPTYDDFVSGSTDWLEPARSRDCDLSDAIEISGELNAVALDIPLAARPPASRRHADNEISRAYGGRGASTHSPLPGRPGKIAGSIYSTLVSSGFQHLTARKERSLDERIFFETYPHPVIIDMMALDYRLEYKVRNRGKFWPELPSEERWQMSARALDLLRGSLSERIAAVNSLIPSAVEILNGAVGSKLRVLQGIEEALDAVVCAFAGWKVATGLGTAFGDESAAIWLPAVDPA